MLRVGFPYVMPLLEAKSRDRSPTADA
jgi:hypothetical protein